MLPAANNKIYTNTKTLDSNGNQTYMNSQNNLNVSNQIGNGNQPMARTVIQKKRELTEKEHERINNIIESRTKVEKTEVINFEEIKIRRSLFFRLYVSGTIEYGNVSYYIILNYNCNDLVH